MTKRRAYTNAITLVPAVHRATSQAGGEASSGEGKTNYVPAKPIAQRITPAEVEIIEQRVTHQPYRQAHGEPSMVGETPVSLAFQAREAARETTTGRDRAVATVIRMAPMTAIFAILAAGLAAALRLSLGQALVIFALIAGVTYYRFNRTDYEHSTAGVERHRIDRAAELAQAKLAHDNRLRRELAQAYLAHLEHSQRGGDHA